MSKLYKLVRKNKYKKADVDLALNKKRGFKITPKNKIKYDGVVVNEMMIIKPTLIEKLLKKKISVKLDNYLQYIISVLDDESSDAGRIGTVLSDLNRYREVVKNNYRQYLNEKYIELLLKKIELLEYELKKKLMILNTYNYSKIQDEYEIKEEKRRKSR